MAAAVIGVVILSLLFPVPFHGRAATAVGDLVHAPLFASLTLGCLWVLQRLKPLQADSADDSNVPITQLLRRGLAVWFAVSLFGALMEVAQAGFGRSMSRHDAIANAIGSAAAVLLYLSTQRRGHRRFEYTCVLLAVAMVLAVWLRPIRLLSDVVQLHRQFPLLATFETSAELTRWYVREAYVRRVSRDATDGEYSLEVTFAPTSYPAITLIELESDWSGFSALELDASLDEHAASPTANLVVKVVEGTEFLEETNASFLQFRLYRGEQQTIRVGLPELSQAAEKGDLDFRRIIFVDLGLMQPDTPTTVRFDSIRLTQ